MSEKKEGLELLREPFPATKNVYQCIAEVQKLISKEGITKSRTNTQGAGYKFRGIDDVYNSLCSLLADVGLVVLPSYTERTLTERETQKGTALFTAVVKGSYKLYSSHDGTSVDVGPFWGEAMDVSDKATNKAMSAAFKYMAMQTFWIPTEGDNDADASTHQAKGQKSTVEALKDANITPAGGVAEGLSQDRRMRAELIASLVMAAWKIGDENRAYIAWNDADLDADEKVAAWALMDSKCRARLKAMRKQRSLAAVPMDDADRMDAMRGSGST